MKKKIVFVMNSLSIGGAEKSLVTILSLFDYKKYEVDLFLFGVEGEFLKQLPKEVNLLAEDVDFKKFEKNKAFAPLIFLINKKPKKAFYSLLYIFGYIYNKLLHRKAIYLGWNHVKHIISGLNKNYDVSIGFMERYSLYFNIDKAKKKIGFIHNNYKKYPFDYKLDKYYFNFYDNIATVSNTCLEALNEYFPEYKDKFLVIKNMISKKMIKEMGKEPIDIKKKKDEIWISTVGRLVYQKGLDNAIDVCDILVNKLGYNIKWYVFGEGEEKENLLTKIKRKNLENHFILYGATNNPYKWIEKSDIYVTTSRFEGYAVTVLEAKALAKPIVGNNIKEIAEQITDGVNGYLANTNEEIAQKIKLLIDNKSVRDKFIDNLKKDNTIENKEELSKIYDLL